MAILSNPKHEKFARAVAKGRTAEKAYVSAGYSRTAARACASRLLTKANIKNRIAELSEKITTAVVAEAVVDKKYVLSVLQEITERCLQHRPVMRDGKPLTVKTKSGERAAVYTFNAHGATRAAHLLGLEVGMFGNVPRLPGGMSPPLGGDLPGGTINNTQINVFQALNEGGLQAVRAHIRELRGLDTGPVVPGVPALSSPN